MTPQQFNILPIAFDRAPVLSVITFAPGGCGANDE